MNRLPVLERTYDFVRWLVPVVVQFPRQQRYLLGDRLEVSALELLDLLVEASLSPEDRIAALRKANVRVDRIAWLLRLSHDLTFLGDKRYAHACKLLDEIGVQAGGWLKATARRVDSADRKGALVTQQQTSTA